MTSWQRLRVKLERKLMEWPESRRHEQAPGMGMTWGKIVDKLFETKEKKLFKPKISEVKRLVRRAEEVGLI